MAPARENFWSNKVRRACNFHLLLFARVVNCEAEVNKFDFVVLTKHYVVGFYVSVNNVLSVAMLQSSQQLRNFDGDFMLCPRVIFLNYLREKLSTSAEFHAQINMFNVVVCLVILDDVGVVDSLHQLHLIHQIIKVFVR